MALPLPLFVAGRFPPPFDGQTLATERIASLLEDRFEVRRLNTQAPEGAHVRGDEGFSLSRFQHYLRLGPALRAALAEHPTAPVLWNSISPIPLGHWRDVLTTLPAFRPGQPVYAVMHRHTFDRLLARPLTALTARRIVRRIAGFVFQSEHLASSCAAWIPSHKRHIIPNTLDDALLCSPDEVAAKQAAYSTDRPLRILFVSNMLREKGYLDVLQAILLLHGQGLPVEADFVGGWMSGDSRTSFVRRATETLGDRVRVHGAVTDRSSIRAFHLAADALVLPTYHPTETQPKAILEALNAGTPVVMTHRPIAHDIMTDEVEGYLVPARSPESIAEALKRLREPQRWRSLSEHARKRFETAFSPDSVRTKWERLLGSAPVFP